MEVVRNLVRGDRGAQDLLDQAEQNPPSLHAVNNVHGRPSGNGADRALRRLRKDRPDLHTGL